MIYCPFESRFNFVHKFQTENTEFKYDWSYIVSWVGVGMSLWWVNPFFKFCIKWSIEFFSLPSILALPPSLHWLPCVSSMTKNERKPWTCSIWCQVGGVGGKFLNQTFFSNKLADKTFSFFSLPSKAAALWTLWICSLPWPCCLLWLTIWSTIQSVLGNWFCVKSQYKFEQSFLMDCL